MAALRFRLRIWFRSQRRTVVLTGLVVGLLAGIAMGVVAGTRRTSSSPDRYTTDAGGDPDLQIVQMAGPPMLDAVGALPGVSEAKGFAFVLAFPLSPKDGTPLTELNPFAGNDDVVGSRVVEGRFTDPESPDEFTVNGVLAEQLRKDYGTKVGDRFTIASFSFQQLRSDLDLATVEPEVPPFEATLVGITEAPLEFDESGAQLVFSRGFLTAHADVGVVQTLIAAYLDPGTSPRSVLDAARAMPDGADAYSVPLRIVSDSARRAVRFQTIALWLVSALAMVAAGVVAALIGARALRVGDGERRTTQALGWTRRQLAAERAGGGAVLGLFAAPVAIVVAYLVTGAFPIGELRKFEPHPGLRLDWLVTFLGPLAVVALLAVVGGVIGFRKGSARSPRTTAATVRGEVVTVGLGVHFATVDRYGRRTWTSAIVGALGIAGLVGAAVAGASLTDIVEHGDRWGIAFDQLHGNPYAAAESDIVTPVLDLPDIDAVTGATLGAVTVEGSDVATFAFHPAKGRPLLTVVDGRAPTGDDEIALGAEVTRRLGLDIGDRVEVGGTSGETARFDVVGIVVTPDSAGNGAALPFDSYAALNPGATENLVLVGFSPGAPASTGDAVSAAIYSPPDALAPPTTIKALERVTLAPFLLCLVFAVMLLVAWIYLLSASVRGRSGDFASLGAMGAVRRQRTSIVYWQATVAVGAMVVIGVPLGVLAGRRIVESIVTTLGIVPGTTVPAWLLVAAIGAPLLVANLVAVLPGRGAARAATSALRSATTG